MQNGGSLLLLIVLNIVDFEVNRREVVEAKFGDALSTVAIGFRSFVGILQTELHR